MGIGGRPCRRARPRRVGAAGGRLTAAARAGPEGSGARRPAAPPGPGFALRRSPPSLAPGPAPRPVWRGGGGGGGVGGGGGAFVRRHLGGDRASASARAAGEAGGKRPRARRVRARRPRALRSSALAAALGPASPLPRPASRLAAQGPPEASGLRRVQDAASSAPAVLQRQPWLPIPGQGALLFSYKLALRWHHWLQDLSQLCGPCLSPLPLSPEAT